MVNAARQRPRPVRGAGRRVDHPVALHAPHYAEPSDGTCLHRFLDEEFLPRFLQQARAGSLLRAADQSWRHEDRFGGHDDHPSLRLPLHRSFYVACCEVSCAMPGAPALDPARIIDAGLVVRRGAGGEVRRWMLRDGLPQGWRGGEVPEHDPDDYRRLRAKDLIPERSPPPAYSGEEVHPMHPVVVQAPDAGGRPRSRTLLYGYLPLGGSHRQSDAAPAEVDTDAPAPDYRAELLWPFGTASSHAWRQGDGLAVSAGVTAAPFRELLDVLVNRYRVQDATETANAPLRVLLARIDFRSPAPAVAFGEPGDPDLPAGSREESLLDYLERREEPLMQWLLAVQNGEQPGSYRLPAHGGSLAPAAESALARRTDALYITEDQAASLRDLLALRAEGLAEASAAGLPLPRFSQAADDIYFARPFIRYLAADGCERVQWGPSTAPFRVAGPMDPQAARPSLVQLPDLGALRRGGPGGLTVLTPKALADKIRKLKLDMDVKEGGPGNRAGLCWSVSFSLPVITLCALILLMIVINLLNIIFFWLPYAILALPRRCLKSLAGNGS